MCLFGGGGCIKYEGRIIKNVNWLLHKNQLCMFSSLYPPRSMAPLISMRREEVARGVYELRPHRERNQTFLNAETG